VSTETRSRQARETPTPSQQSPPEKGYYNSLFYPEGSLEEHLITKHGLSPNGNEKNDHKRDHAESRPKDSLDIPLIKHRH